MRAWLPALIVALLTTFPAAGRAQAVHGSRSAMTSSPEAVDQQRRASTAPAASGLERLAATWKPLQQRLPENERFRVLSGVVGVGVLAYEGTASRRALPLALLGTEALRMALRPQLRAVRDRTSFVVEPSIGRRRFAVIVRRDF
jgi:hypothetical protein